MATPFFLYCKEGDDKMTSLLPTLNQIAELHNISVEEATELQHNMENELRIKQIFVETILNKKGIDISSFSNKLNYEQLINIIKWIEGGR